MKIGILTGGGDCPGLNAVIRGAVHAGAHRYDQTYVGLRRGWKGLLEQETSPLDPELTYGILAQGGTILGSSRTNPYARDGGPEAAVEAINALGLDGLVAIGGEDTLGVAEKLHNDFGAPVIGVPKTIDNDLSGTDYSFGFWTCVQIGVAAIDRLQTTAASHDRVLVVEVMGRHAGWIALECGRASGADCIVIPEVPLSVRQVCDIIGRRRAAGQRHAIVVVSEGAEFESYQVETSLDEFGHVSLADRGVGEYLAKAIEQEMEWEARAVVLGHVQRGGTPLAYDRSLGTRMGIQAAKMIHERKFGRMASLRGEEVTDVPLSEAVGRLRTVPPAEFTDAEVFFGR